MDRDHTTSDIGESSVSGSCSATASYGGDEADSDYTTTSDAETQDSDAEGKGPRAAKKQRQTSQWISQVFAIIPVHMEESLYDFHSLCCTIEFTFLL